MTKKTYFFSRGFTIIESLVMLGILFVLTMVIIALVKYANSPGESSEKEDRSSAAISLSLSLCDPRPEQV